MHVARRVLFWSCRRVVVLMTDESMQKLQAELMELEREIKKLDVQLVMLKDVVHRHTHPDFIRDLALTQGR